MLTEPAPRAVTGSATSRTLSAVNRKALEHAKALLAQNSQRLANADGVSEIEREHHAQIARMATR